jgi:hypothetical protein
VWKYQTAASKKDLRAFAGLTELRIGFSEGKLVHNVVNFLI